MLFFKTFIFFQKFKQAKNRFSIKVDTENFVFLHFYDRKSFGINSHQIVFVNKKKFLTKVKVNSQMIFDDVKNITMYFFKLQREITRFMIQYNFLRKSYKTFNKESR